MTSEEVYFKNFFYAILHLRKWWPKASEIKYARNVQKYLKAIALWNKNFIHPINGYSWYWYPSFLASSLDSIKWLYCFNQDILSSKNISKFWKSRKNIICWMLKFKQIDFKFMILFTNVNCNHKYIFIVKINIALQIEIWGKKEEVSDRLQKNLCERTRNVSISCQWYHLFQLLCNTRKHSQKEPFGDVLQNKCS